jgi:hypothetical protein
MREVGVEAHIAAIAGTVDAGDRVPHRRRRLALDAQIALAAAFHGGMRYVHGDGLRLPAARLPDRGGGKTRRGDGGLRRGVDAERRRQHRLLPAQRDHLERRRLAAAERPETGENFSGSLHECSRQMMVG